MKQKTTFILLALVALPFLALADVYLPNIFQSNMVLQQQTEIAVWGWAAPSEKVTVKTSWDDQTYMANGTDNATFRLTLKTPVGSNKPQTLTVSTTNNTILLENILIGEVWICAGQSNMEWSAHLGIADAKSELPTCYNENLRFFRVPKTTSATPQDNCRGTWRICDSVSLRYFSAVGYFFGKKLNQKMGISVGLIDLAWGGSYMESWIPTDLVNLYPDTKLSAERMIKSKDWPSSEGRIFNGEVAPLSNFSIAGVIWYQGESNRHNPSTYYKLTHILIDTWRNLWGKDFPFYTVQIAPFNYKDSTVSKAALIREAQTKAMDIPKSGMVVVTDLVDDINDIHPKYKQQVGYRLGNWALAETYNQPIGQYKSPQLRNFSIKNNAITVEFSNAENGLKTEGNADVSDFLLAGTDKIFYKATAKIVGGNKIEVRCDQVPNPVAVRFAFNDTAQPNVFSKDGLPICPFRTDSW